MEGVLLAAMLVLVGSFVLVEIKMFKARKGTRRLLVALPALGMLIVVGSIVMGILMDRTAHNLWPFEIVLSSAGGLVYLGIFRVIEKIAYRS